MFRQSAALVDKIMKGAKPAVIPVEYATDLELIINTKTARTLNINIPPTLLSRADKLND
jgi:putative tryptophan/tyrosine transport system substrate-binding protein